MLEDVSIISLVTQPKPCSISYFCCLNITFMEDFTPLVHRESVYKVRKKEDCHMPWISVGDLRKWQKRVEMHLSVLDVWKLLATHKLA